MDALTARPLDADAPDPDLAEQARPGHGVPSQDPSSAAQFALEPEEATREAKSALVGGGVVAGAATGAAIGVAVAGPMGVLVGAALGAAAGALGGAAAGTTASSVEEVRNPAAAPTGPVIPGLNGKTGH